MKRRVLFVVAISAVGAALVGVALWRWESRHAAPSDTVAEMDTALADVATMAPTDAPNTKSSTSIARQGSDALLDPLPPLDMPLAQALPELEQRARVGDRSAACRLAVERQTCGSLEDDLIVHDRWLAERERALSAGIKGVSAEEVRQAFEAELGGRERRLNWKVKHCEGVPPTDGKADVDAWRRAAQLGSWAAMRDYASGAVFEWSNLLANADQLSQYKSEAERMALTVASWGDVPMNLALADAYSPYPQGDIAKSLLRQAVKPNAAMALAMYKRLQRDLATVVPDATISNAASSVEVRVRNEVAFLESRMNERDRARADDILMRVDRQWHPATQGLQRDVAPYIGEQSQRSPRYACGQSRDQ